LLQKARAETEVFNDLDGEMVNLFRVLSRPCWIGSHGSAAARRQLASVNVPRTRGEVRYGIGELEDPEADR
jgi:hypothetical protein